MEKQKKFRVFFWGFIFLSVMGLTKQTASAASATVSFSISEEEVCVGDEVNVSIDIDADSAIDSVEAYIHYDSSMLEYLTGADGLSGGSGTLKLTDMLSDEELESTSYQAVFRAKKKGSCLIEFSEQPIVYEADTEDAMSVSYEDISIPIKKAVVLSNNTKLDSLQISPGSLEPSFSPSVREYKTYVGAATNNIMVSAVASDADATVAVRGNEGLLEGENLVVITVTAPSGKKKKYKLYVKKEAAEPDIPEEPEETENDTKVSENTDSDTSEDFRIQEKNGKIVLKNKTVYTLVDLEDSSLIPSGYVRTKLILYGVSITAYTLETDLENDFILVYAKRKGEEPGFYQYDREEKTMQRFSGSAAVSSENKIVVGEETGMSVNEYNEKVQKLSVVVGISAGIAVLFAIGMLAFAIKYFKAKSGGGDDFSRW